MEDSIRIMKRLNDYTFLACSQMNILWFQKSKKSLYHLLKSLRERNLINSTSYKYSPRDGRVEDIHFLTPKWYNYISKLFGEDKEIQKIKSHKSFYEDYDHRKKTISSKIALEVACQNYDLKLIEYYQYFETKRRNNNRRQISTKITQDWFIIIPDSVFKMHTKDRIKLYCFEYHKGYRVKKIESQIKKYVIAISDWTPSLIFNVNTNAKVLVVFEKESTMKSTIELIANNNYYDNFINTFLFKTYDDFIKDPLHHWVNSYNKNVSLW